MAKARIPKPKTPRNTTISKIAKEAAKEQQKQIAAAMREYRHQLAMLKRKGLISKSIDVRKVKTRQSNLTRAINEFRDVLEGKAVAVKVPKEVQARKKALGAKVRHGRVIIPKLPNERVYVSPKGSISHVVKGKQGGITRIEPNVAPQDIEDYLRQLSNQESKTRGKHYGFQYFGNNSHSIADNFEHLLMILQYYNTLQMNIDNPNPEIQQEYITNLVFFKFDYDEDFMEMPEPAKTPERLAQYRERQRLRREKWLANMPPDKYERYLESQRLKDKKKYERRKLTDTPEQAEARKAKNREAQRRARARRKPKE